MIHTLRRRAGAALAVAVTVALAACSSGGSSVQVKSEDQAKTVVQQHVEQIAHLTGGSPTNPKWSTPPCTGKAGESGHDVYTMSGAYNLTVREGSRTAGLERVRTAWKNAGYTITDDRTLNNDDGVLAGAAPDGTGITLQGTDVPTLFALIVNSPCYKRP